MVQSLWTGWNDGGAALEQFPKTIKSILDNDAWRDREVDGKLMHNDTFREFIIVPPLRGCGWGKQIDAIEKLLGLKDQDIQRRWQQAMVGAHGVHHDTDNISIMKPAHGTSRADTLRRLHKDHLELYERVIAGDLSANAAAIEAGFRKKPSPFEQIIKLLPKLTSDEHQQLVAHLSAK